MILVTGSGGKTGRAVASALEQRGYSLRLFRHNGSESESLQELPGGIQIFFGDLERRQDLEEACRGVRGIYHIGPNMHPREDVIGFNLIEAARSANIEHLVFHSVLHPHIKRMPHHWRKLKVEGALVQSGIPFTILQPAAYFQNFGNHWAEIKQSGEFRIPYRLDAKLSLVDLQEVAEVAARTMLMSEHAFATYPLASRSAPSQIEIARAMSQLANKPIKALRVSLNEWSKSAREGGMSLDRLKDFLAMFEYYGEYDFLGNGEILAWLLGRTPTTLVDYLRRINEGV